MVVLGVVYLLQGKLARLRQVTNPNSQDNFQICCADMFLIRFLANFVEFRSSATMRNIRSPEYNCYPFRQQVNAVAQSVTINMSRWLLAIHVSWAYICWQLKLNHLPLAWQIRLTLVHSCSRWILILPRYVIHELDQLLDIRIICIPEVEWNISRHAHY